MRHKRRSFSTFSLSFLDIMSCGFGAVVLLFLIIKHDADSQIKVRHQDLSAEVDLLSEQVSDGEENLVKLRNILSDTSDELSTAEGLARRIQELLDNTKVKLSALEQDTSEEAIKQLQQEIEKLEQDKKNVEAEITRSGNNPREFLGDGDRQYLTGLRLGGKRNLILLDNSASMLDDTIINVIRRRNMQDDQKRQSPKWQRAINTTRWLISQLPPNSQYQIHSFNQSSQALVKDTQGQWLTTANKEQLETTDQALGQLTPEKGSSLINGFTGIKSLSPLPDNIYLITDGLPTLGPSFKRGTITGAERYKLFAKALKVRPPHVPINIILLPFEGDPLAASAYWQLAISSSGSFMAPARDWP